MEKRRKLVENYYKNKIKNVELFVDNVWNPHNVAAITRSADGFGISKINLYYTYNKFPDFDKIGKKSSSSATKWINFEKIEDIDNFVKMKKNKGFLFLGAEYNTNSFRLNSFKFPEKCIIVIGSEHRGISKEVKNICDNFIFIPMTGMVKSYNVSVATAIILYELFRQKGKNLDLRI